MDIATLLGFILGFVFLLWGISLTGTIGTFIHLPSLVLVLGGAVSATIISLPLKKFINSFKILKNIIASKDTKPYNVIQDIVDLANIARKEGLLALEDASEKVNDSFLRKGSMLIVDGTDPELVRSILETELSFLEERHRDGQGIFETLGSFAPAFGMIGTLIGLINMLKDLEDPARVGPNMSVALITTFYGSLFANLIFLPIANKLKIRSKEEILVKELIVEGLLSIQAGENPRIIEEKLKTFLSPEQRTSIMKEAEGEGA